MQRSYGEKVEIKEKDYDEEWTKSAYQAKDSRTTSAITVVIVVQSLSIF